MLEAVAGGGIAAPPRERDPAVTSRPDFLDWLGTGRLTLIDQEKEPVSPERWAELPPDVRARAQHDFHRLVRGGTKAAVIYLR
jgi:hypothetical protein